MPYLRALRGEFYRLSLAPNALPGGDRKNSQLTQIEILTNSHSDKSRLEIKLRAFGDDPNFFRDRFIPSPFLICGIMV